MVEAKKDSAFKLADDIARARLSDFAEALRQAKQAQREAASGALEPPPPPPARES
jgi:hypothetical protein